MCASWADDVTVPERQALPEGEGGRAMVRPQEHSLSPSESAPRLDDRDPLEDLLADLARAEEGWRVSSSHDGSEGYW